MKSCCVIVKARQEHVSAAADIAVQAWTPIREGFKNQLGEELYNGFFTDWQKAKRAVVTEELLSENGYVALVGDAVAGFISYTVDYSKKSGEICNNAVSPDYRGMGIASALYDFVINKMKECGIKYVTVTTGLDDAHAAARHVYEKAGFSKNLQSITYYKTID